MGPWDRTGSGTARRRSAALLPLGVLLGALACESAPARTASDPARDRIDDPTFVALVARISEPGGYFDTDNLISNETGYLKVMGTLEGRVAPGLAFIGVGPDQSYSYVARLKPRVAFLVDIRRDNLLHHLLLKTLIERAPGRLEFLCGLLGRPLPPDPSAWRSRSIEEIVAYLDAHPDDDEVVARVEGAIAQRLEALGVPLDASDRSTIRRFHRTFVEAGLGLRFQSFGRPPRPYDPTLRELVLGTDMEGELAGYLASREGYETVRDLHRANRIIPVVGDLAGAHAVREIGRVLREMELGLGAFYTSNVEYYLWREGRIEAWRGNLGQVPMAEGAVLIRSVFPSGFPRHPSAVPGSRSAQTLQPVEVFLEGAFGSYQELVTRGILDLR